MTRKAMAVAGLAVTLLAAAPGDDPREDAWSGRTVFVPVVRVGDGVSRLEAHRLTEQVIKAIEGKTPLRVVGSPEKADLIFEGTLKVGGRAAR